MMWEYVTTGNLGNVIDTLNKFGQAGWEMCGIERRGGPYTTYFFKRPIEREQVEDWKQE